MRTLKVNVNDYVIMTSKIEINMNRVKQTKRIAKEI